MVSLATSRTPTLFPPPITPTPQRILNRSSALTPLAQPTRINADELGPSRTPTPTQDIPSPTPALTEALISADTPGAVSGQVCGPGADLPRRTAYFENLATLELNVLAVPKDQTTYNLDLAPGQYIAYAYEKGKDARGGLYSAAVPCGLTEDCTDHNPLSFTVEPGLGLGEIDLCDWSAPESVPPNPAPKDPRLAGMIYTLNGVNYFHYDDQGEAQFLMFGPYGPDYYTDLKISPDRTRGVFKDYEKQDLFIVDFTTGELFNLTNSPQLAEESYWWEPNMPNRVLFRANWQGEGEGPGYWDRVYAIGVDGSGLQPIEIEEHVDFDPHGYHPALLEDTFLSAPSWSPDKKKIVWSLSGNISEQFHQAYALFDLETKTLHILHLYNAPGCECSPGPARWSPDGKWFVLGIYSYEPEQMGTWLINASRPEEEYFLGDSGSEWHPKGRWLAYTRWDSSNEPEAWLINLHKPEEKTLLGKSTEVLEWSPDGEWLAYQQVGVWLYDPKTGERVSLGAPTFGPAWSPDGKWLAYQRYLADSAYYPEVELTEVWLYNSETGKHVKTALPPLVHEVDW
jgi:hypothetical protein